MKIHKHATKAISAIIATTVIAGGGYAYYKAKTPENAQISTNLTLPVSEVVHKAGPPDIYPNPDWNPGFTNPEINQGNISQNICNKNWSTKSIRPPVSYTTPLKIKQIQQYGYTDTNTASYEEDHIISLELGGNPTDPRNLWPEPYNAEVQDGGAKKKDTVENFLHKEVCAGTITLDEAQKEISTDWYQVLHENNL